MQGRIIDSFDVKDRVAIDYGATGVVIIFATDSSAERPVLGAPILVMRPDGWMFRSKMGDVKQHGDDAFGVFLANLDQQAAPIGATVRWGSGFWPESMEADLESVGKVKA